MVRLTIRETPFTLLIYYANKIFEPLLSQSFHPTAISFFHFLFLSPTCHLECNNDRTKRYPNLQARSWYVALAISRILC